MKHTQHGMSGKEIGRGVVAARKRRIGELLALVLTFLLCLASAACWLRRRCLVDSYQARCSKEAMSSKGCKVWVLNVS